MGEIRVNLTNILTIGIIAYLGVYAINRGLTMAGVPQFRA